MKKYNLTHKNNINNNKTHKNIKYLQNGGYKKTYIINNFKFVVTTKIMMDMDNDNNNSEINNEISTTNSNMNDTKDYIKITIGSGNRKCVEITIHNDNLTNASLDRFDYQQDCNISKDMVRKIDTQKMMDTLILFLKNEIKTDMDIDIDIKTLTLEDVSKRRCEGTKHNIIYYDLYLFKYGMPYYNYTYEFDFYYESDREQHSENLRLINGVTINKTEFIKFLMSKKINIDIVKDNIVNHTQNIAEFLDTIIDDILATEFIKHYLHKEHLSYLLHYFFMYMKQLTGYQTITYFTCVKHI